MKVTQILFYNNENSITDNEIKNLFNIFDTQVINNSRVDVNLETAKNQINKPTGKHITPALGIKIRKPTKNPNFFQITRNHTI